MKYGAILMLIVFLTVAFFGFVSMNHEMGHAASGDYNCLVADIFNFSCTVDVISMVAQHIAAFQSFVSITLSLPLIMAIIITCLLLLAGLALYLSPPRLEQQLAKNDYLDERFLSTKKIFSWLSLLENSPSFS